MDPRFSSGLFSWSELRPLFINQDKHVASVSLRGSIIVQPWASSRFYAAIGCKSRLPRLFNVYGGIGNTDLNEERNLLTEVGVSQSLGKDRVVIGATWFRNEVKGKIDFVRLPGPRRRGQDQNVEDATAMGVELIASVSVTESTQVSIDYTYTDIQVDTQGEPNFDRYFHQLNGRIQYAAPWGLSAGLQVTYIDGEPDAFPSNSPIGVKSQVNFVLINGKISFQVFPGFRPFLAIGNLTDSNYVRNIGFPEPGRRFFMGVHAQF